MEDVLRTGVLVFCDVCIPKGFPRICLSIQACFFKLLMYVVGIMVDKCIYPINKAVFIVNVTFCYELLWQPVQSSPASQPSNLLHGCLLG